MPPFGEHILGTGVEEATHAVQWNLAERYRQNDQTLTPAERRQAEQFSAASIGKRGFKGAAEPEGYRASPKERHADEVRSGVIRAAPKLFDF